MKLTQQSDRDIGEQNAKDHASMQVKTQRDKHIPGQRQTYKAKYRNKGKSRQGSKQKWKLT